ncbi:MAG: hypothetical protein SPL42_09455 [Bacteroidales bacterium]|nr:hypothetical protein [Bacteroidales bacterium]
MRLRQKTSSRCVPIVEKLRREAAYSLTQRTLYPSFNGMSAVRSASQK